MRPEPIDETNSITNTKLTHADVGMVQEIEIKE